MRAIDLLKNIRTTILKTVEPLTSEQLLKIPSGFNNNILWNLSHLVATQQILNYKLSGLEMNVGEKFVEENRKGSSPTSWSIAPDIEFVKDKLVTLPQLLESDLTAGKFSEFKPYKTSLEFEIASIEDSINFNNFHEGLHLGAILGLKN